MRRNSWAFSPHVYAGPLSETTVPKPALAMTFTHGAGVTEPAGIVITYSRPSGENPPSPLARTRSCVPSSTAADSAPNTVRVSWAGSVVIDLYSPKHGISLSSGGVPDLPVSNPRTLYAISKAGNLFYASEYGKICTGQHTGIVSTCFNPGNLKTELQRYVAPLQSFFQSFILHPAIFGAFTELYSGFSGDVTTENNGCYIAPWGRIGENRVDVQESCKDAQAGGNGIAKAFWDRADIP